MKGKLSIPDSVRHWITAVIVVAIITSTFTPVVAVPTETAPNSASISMPITKQGAVTTADDPPPDTRPRASASSPPSTTASSLFSSTLPSQAAPSPSGPLSSTPRTVANVTIRNVTLVTGQTVTVISRGNRTQYRIDAKVPMHQVRTPRGTYIYPAGTDFDTFNRALFNIDLLLQQGLTDQQTDTIPIIIKRNTVNRRGRKDSALPTYGSKLGVETSRNLESINAVAGTIQKSSAEQTVEALRADASVRKVYLDKRLQVSMHNSTSVINTGQARAEYNVSGKNVTVAVLDTGIDNTHPDLDEGTVILEKDFTDDGTVEDLFGHGTHVAAIIAGDGDASNVSNTGTATSSEEWWNTSWSFRKQVNVTEQSGHNLSNYPLAFTLSHNGHAQADCADIRVTDNGKPLPYAIRNCTAQQVTIAIKQNLPANGSTRFFVYYGNPAVKAANASWNTVRYNIYDNFNNGTIDPNWSRSNPSAWSEEGGVLKYASDTKAKAVWQTPITYPAKTIYRAQNHDAGWNPNAGIGFLHGNWSGNPLIRPVRGAIGHHDQYKNSTGGSVPGSTSDLGTWHVWNSTWNINGQNIHVKNSSETITQPESASFVSDARFFIHANTGNPGDEVWWDWVKVRKYVQPEPEIAVGAEQSTTDRSTTKNHIGVAPNASLINARVLNEEGFGRTSWIIQGIEYSVNHSADIISMSLGGYPRRNDPLAQASNWAVKQGVTVSVAAGNSYSYLSVATPGIAKRAITVGASNGHGEIAWFSSRGPTRYDLRPKPDVVAPGVDVISARASGTSMGDPVNQYYTRASGTSMATPMVSGVAALLEDAHPSWTPKRIKNVLLSTATPIEKSSGEPYDIYTQGAGRVNATSALGTDVLVHNATISAGVFTNATTVNRTLTVTNIGNVTHTLDISVVEHIDIRVGNSARIEPNRTTVTLTPGETADIRLKIYTFAETTGIYSNRIQITSENTTYTAVVGYTRARKITVKKSGVNGTSVNGDEVWLFSHNDFPWNRFTEIDSGTSSLLAFDSKVTVWSVGIDESTGGAVMTSNTTTVSSDMTIHLNESNTVPYRIDAAELNQAEGKLANLSVQSDIQKQFETLDGGTWVYEWDFINPFVSTRTVRFTKSPSLNASVQYWLVPKKYHNGTRKAGFHADSPVVYQLVYPTIGVDGPETFTVDRSQLARNRKTYYRTTPGQTYSLLQFAHHNVWEDFFDTGFIWNLRDRRTQTIYLTPESVDYWPIAVGDGWYLAGLDAIETPNASETMNTSLNRHPYTGKASWFDIDKSGFDFGGWFQADQGEPETGIRHYYENWASNVNNTLIVRRNGSVVHRENTTWPIAWYFNDSKVRGGTTFNVTMVGRNLQGAGFATNLSTRTRTEFHTTFHPSGDSEPPRIVNIHVPDLGVNNTVSEGNVTVYVTTTDTSSIASLSVLYAPSSVESRPGETWENAFVTKVKSSTSNGFTTYKAVLNLSGFDNRVNIAVGAADASGNWMGTAAYDAFWVGDVSTERETRVYGSIEYADGTIPEKYVPILINNDPFGVFVLSLNQTGEFDTKIPGNETYVYTFVQRDGDLQNGTEYPRDGRPDIHHIKNVTVGMDAVDLNHTTLPPANLLHVQVVNETGLPITDVPVQISGGEITSWPYQPATTNQSGYVKLVGAAQTGIEANGSVSIRVNPSEVGLPFPDTTRHVNLTKDKTITITLEEKTQPAVVSLSANDTTVVPGQDISVNVTIDPNGQEVYGAQVNVTFNASLLNATAVEKGPFLTQDGANSTIFARIINNRTGQISYAEARRDVDHGVTEASALAQFTLHVAENATTPKTTLQLTDIILSDPNATEINAATANLTLQPQPVHLNVTPKRTSTGPGDTFTTHVTIATEGQGVFGGQATVTFNESLLNATDIELGGFLSKDGAKVLTPGNSIDNVNGTVNFGATRTNTDKDIAGSGTLFHITFRADENAPLGSKSAINFVNVKISDSDGNELPTTTRNGTVNVSNVRPAVNATLLFTVNNIGSPLTVRANASDADGNVTSVALLSPNGTNLASKSCATPACVVSLSNTPPKSTWNGSAYDTVTLTVKVTDDKGGVSTDTVTTSVYIAGDANGDGVVDIFDAVIVGQHWKEECSGETPPWKNREQDRADLNNDCSVDIFDAVILGQNWKATAE